MRFTADSRRLFVASEQAHVVSVIDMTRCVSVNRRDAAVVRRIVLTADGSRSTCLTAVRDVRVLDSASLTCSR